MNNKVYFNAKDISEMLDVSRSKAYSIIRDLNSELKAKGFLILDGKISRKFFDEKWYGGSEQEKAQPA